MGVLVYSDTSFYFYFNVFVFNYTDVQFLLEFRLRFFLMKETFIEVN